MLLINKQRADHPIMRREWRCPLRVTSSGEEEARIRVAMHILEAYLASQVRQRDGLAELVAHGEAESDRVLTLQQEEQFHFHLLPHGSRGASDQEKRSRHEDPTRRRIETSDG